MISEKFFPVEDGYVKIRRIVFFGSMMNTLLTLKESENFCMVHLGLKWNQYILILLQDDNFFARQSPGIRAITTRPIL